MRGLTYKHTIYASYVGYITQAIVNNLVPLLFLILQDTYGIPLHQITALITVNFCVQLTVDFLSARFADGIGYRTCIVASHIFAAAGLVGVSILPDLLPSPFAGLLLSVVLYAIGGGLLEVLVSPIVEACPTDNKASYMSLLHSFYCWGVVGVTSLSTVFLAIFGKENWRILLWLWALIPACNALFFSRVPIAHLVEDGQGMSMKELFSQKIFWMFVVLMIASGASELAMSQWASAFAEQGLGVSKALGDLAGPCMFAVLMGCARVLSAKFDNGMDLTVCMMASAAVCAVSYLLTALSPNPILALIGCGLCGLSVGILWPGVFSLASVHCPRGGTAMFALLALSGDLGCSSGPTLVGMVADAFGGQLNIGLLAAPIFPIVLFLCCLLLRRHIHKGIRK